MLVVAWQLAQVVSELVLCFYAFISNGELSVNELCKGKSACLKLMIQRGILMCFNG